MSLFTRRRKQRQRHKPMSRGADDHLKLINQAAKELIDQGFKGDGLTEDEFWSVVNNQMETIKQRQPQAPVEKGED